MRLLCYLIKWQLFPNFSSEFVSSSGILSFMSTAVPQARSDDGVTVQLRAVSLMPCHANNLNCLAYTPSSISLQADSPPFVKQQNGTA